MRNQFIFETESFSLESEDQTTADARGFRARRALRNLQTGVPADGHRNPDTFRAPFANRGRTVNPDSEFEFETAPAPVNKFDNCTTAQKVALNAIFRKAQSALNKAAAVLGSIYGGSSPMSAQTRQLLNTHFHTTDRGNILKIFRTIFRINQAFQKGLKFECETNCGTGTCGYAWATQWFGGYGDIHICFDNRPQHCSFMSLSEAAKIAVLIHEAAHRHVGIDDKVYVWEKPPVSTKDYSKLTPGKAMDNADSYAWFCAQ